jgi:hypothetical protein
LQFTLLPLASNGSFGACLQRDPRLRSFGQAFYCPPTIFGLLESDASTHFLYSTGLSTVEEEIIGEDRDQLFLELQPQK